MAMLLVQQDKKRWEKLDITVFSEANWGKWHWLCNLSSSQVEFKLKLEKQAVASTTKIRASLWGTQTWAIMGVQPPRNLGLMTPPMFEYIFL